MSRNKYGFFLMGGVVTGLILLGLIWLFLFYSSDSPGRSELFLGRLHPVVVHLPIGVLLAVFFYELTTLVYPRLRNLPIMLFLIWIGFITAVVSALAGFFLALTGGYDASYLFWHKWLGMLVAVTSGICFLLAGLEYLNRKRRMSARRYRNIYRSVLLTMVVFLSITGHLGGTLTHGPGYVTEYLPRFVKGPLGLDESTTPAGSKKIKDIKKAEIYGDLVKPVLEKKCVSCHGPSKKKGDLRLDTKEAIQKGGENGKIIQPGKPEKSELVRRITLPLYHEEVMPPDDKKPLSIGNTELIRWWVATGASFDKTVGEVDSETIPPAVQTKLDRISAKPEPDRLVVYDTDVPAADKKKVEQLRHSTDWKLSYLSKDTRFLEVRYAPDGKEKLKRSDLAKLKPIRKQLAWLDLRERKLTDDAWAYLKKFPLLNRLHAERSNIQDRHLTHLSSHEYLVYLNIHHTDISDSGLDHLNLENLEKLYVWQTKISEEQVKKLKKKYQELTIEQGVTDLNNMPLPALVDDAAETLQVKIRPSNGEADRQMVIPFTNDDFETPITIKVTTAGDHGAGWRIDLGEGSFKVPPGETKELPITIEQRAKGVRYPLPKLKASVELAPGKDRSKPIRSEKELTLSLVGSQPTLPVGMVSSTPDVDGRLDDAVWQDKPDVPLLGRMDREQPIKPATKVWTRYDDASMYVAFRCEEPNIDRLKADVSERDGNLWTDDSIEVMLNPEGKGDNYQHLILNSRGVFYDAKVKDKLVDLENVQRAAHVGKDAWTVELAIPWSALEVEGPPEGMTMLFARNRLAGGNKTLFQFPLSPETNHSPDHFARVTFQKAKK